MEIVNFNISIDGKSLIIQITSDQAVNSLLFWDADTYKDYSKAIDLSSYLTGDFYEYIIIPMEELGYKYFSGIYFLEADNGVVLSNAVVSELTKYKECILNNILKYSICEECLKEQSTSLTNSQTLLRGLMDAIDLGFIDEMLLIKKALDKFCSDECRTCGEYKNIINNAYYSTNK